LPDWLTEDEGQPVEAEPVFEAVAPEVEEPEAQPADELPDWLMAAQAPPEETEPVVEAVTAEVEEPEAQPADGLPDWLMAAQAPPEETEPASEAIAAEVEAPEARPVIEAEEQEAVPETVGEFDDDAAFAWLESLAVKQGADEALLLSPEERQETPPDWVQEASQDTEVVAPQYAVPEDEHLQEVPAVIEAQPDIDETPLPDWLTEEQVAPPTETLETIAHERVEEQEALPDWLSEEQVAPSDAPVAFEAAPDIEQAVFEQAAPEQAPQPDWLAEDEAQPEDEPILGDTQPTRVVPPAPAEFPMAAEAVEVQAAVEAEPVISDTPASELPPADELPAEDHSKVDDADAAFAWLESLAVKQGADEALLLSPEERQEAPPEWVQQAAQEPVITPTEAAPVELPTQQEPEIPEFEPEAEQPAEVDIEVRPATEFQPEAPPVAEIPAEKLAPAAEAPTEPAAPGADIDDADAAFAWLESLAVRQGADEALLLDPEERLDTPPQWVQQAAAELPAAEDTAETDQADASDTAAEERGTIDADEAFAWLESLAVRQGADEALLLSPEERQEMPPKWVHQEADETPEQEAHIESEPPTEPDETGVEQPAAEETAEGFASVEDQEAAREEEYLDTEEPKFEEIIAEEPVAKADEEAFVAPAETKDSQAPAESETTVAAVPELPDWLSESPPSGSTDKLEWKLPPVRLDINEGSLAEFEKLPGVGFILAQRIINHRENLGDFKSVEDMLEIPGFSQFILDGLGDRLYVETPPEPETTPEPVLSTAPQPLIIFSDADATAEISGAREALNQGNVSQALDKYASLISAHQSLPEVIQDLQEAANHYPDEINVWQHLGDAYLRDNQITEALQAYTEAEKLLR
ncbi:helix-hairpin-helix domain-containing protein, partial [Chloroflexota bacterium]